MDSAGDGGENSTRQLSVLCMSCQVTCMGNTAFTNNTFMHSNRFAKNFSREINSLYGTRTYINMAQQKYTRKSNRFLSANRESQMRITSAEE